MCTSAGMRTPRVPLFQAGLNMPSQILGHCRGARIASRASVVARAGSNTPHSAPVCGRTLKPCAPFPVRGAIVRRRRLHVVAFRTEDASDRPPQNAIVIGLDFYRCLSAAVRMLAGLGFGLTQSRRPTGSASAAGVAAGCHGFSHAAVMDACCRPAAASRCMLHVDAVAFSKVVTAQR